MRRMALLALLLSTSSAFALNTRSYISGTGDDLNTCATPALACATYARALAMSDPGSDIVVIGSGSFGSGLVITKSINIVSQGFYAANRPGVAISAITITAPSDAVVRLTGLTIEGVFTANSVGVNVQSAGRVELDDMTIHGATTAILVADAGAQVYVSRTRISGFRSTPAGTGAGLRITGDSKVFMNGVTMTGGDIGLRMAAGHLQWVSSGGNGAPSSMAFVTKQYEFAMSDPIGNTGPLIGCTQFNLGSSVIFSGQGTGYPDGGASYTPCSTP